MMNFAQQQRTIENPAETALPENKPRMIANATDSHL